MEIELLAVKGNPKAQYAMGLKYAKTDSKKSFEWIEKSADGGFVLANAQLGKLYK